MHGDSLDADHLDGCEYQGRRALPNANFPTDHVAAQVHRRNAERHYEAAERFRKISLTDAQKAAQACAEQEDALADQLAGVKRNG